MSTSDWIIRPVSESDAPQLAAIYAPYVAQTAITFEYTVPSAEEFAQRIRKTLEFYPYIAAERDGVLLGYAYAGTFKGRAAYAWSVETTVYVAMDLRKSGIGRSLYLALEEALRQQGITNMNACIACPRTEDDPYLDRSSILFHERLGYVQNAHFHACASKYGRWYDMVWMEKMIGEHPQNPSQPVPFRPENI